ncbi:MAG: Fe-S protein assembly co-chaperone HscB [SAR324 cluster bacterium]|nr:Fe-S protein assembly co-chaperone HscB [SAR324 cluster bacterium]
MATPLFCFSCNSIQRLSTKPNYFEIFDLPYTYNLDIKRLEDNYQKLAAELHPDFYLQSASTEKRQSQESSSLLNRAYTALKCPMSRASYLLELLSHGKPLDERKLPAGFLEDIFELQETLEDLLVDVEDHAEELAAVKSDVEKRLNALQEAVSQLFGNIEKDPSNQKNIVESIQVNLNAERYLQRLLERISRSNQV